jgi:hypothetical protein
MKIGTLAMMAAVLATPVVAAQAGNLTVVVCTEGLAGFHAAAPSMAIASEMFASAGVTIDWRNKLAGCPPEGILVTLGMRTSPDLHPGALAYALPYEGAHIRVFYDRIAARGPALMPQLLAHVLVHEITHILQGVSRHSGEGVMKAQWGQGDFNRMLSKPLEFTSEDVSLIHDGLAVRMARSGAVSMNGSE